MRKSVVKLHHFADTHGFVGKIEREHMLLAVAYLLAAVFHIEVALSLAYMAACGLSFFAKA